MGNLVKLIDSLEVKIGTLLNKQSKSTQRALELESDLAESKRQIDQLQEQLDVLKAKNQTLKTANAMLGSNEYKKETKQKINSLIREIDHCIVQLSE